MKKYGIITILICLLGLASFGQAARVGIVIDFPDGATHVECLDVPEGMNGFEVLEKTGMNLEWSPPSAWGHALCGIESVGCPSDNCFCGGEEYWGFFIAEGGDDEWNYMPVGFDAGEECWNRDTFSYDGHYCAADGDILGFRWGTYDVLPEFKRFVDVCPTKRRREREELEITIQPERLVVGKEIVVNTGVKNAEVKVLFDNMKEAFEGIADRDGKISFTLEKSGSYKLFVNAKGFPHTYFDFKVGIEETTTSIKPDE
ncbi:carboxypeptidase-like regulatory domain-containing protein, partial [Candidatus Altiarchaeota archaeon]